MPAGRRVAVAAETAISDVCWEWEGYSDLALAPNRTLFAMKLMAGFGQGIQALDSRTLQLKFEIDPATLAMDEEYVMIEGMAVCGNELFVGKIRDYSILILDLTGEPRRLFTSTEANPLLWRAPQTLCCVDDRIVYLIERFDEDAPDDDDENKLCARQIFAFTPEGESWKVWKEPGGKDRNLNGMAHFDGKLMVSDMDVGDVLSLAGVESVGFPAL